MPAREVYEAALRESEQKFHAVAKTTVNAIVAADSSGRITAFNPAAERVFGYKAEETLGQPITLLLPNSFHKSSLLQESDASMSIGQTIELVGKRSNGTEFPLELSLATWKTASGDSIVAIMLDTSEQKRMSEEVSANSLRLDAINKELESFSYSVSHDLRAPLRAIDGFSQLLLEKYFDKIDERGQRYLQKIRTESQQMAHLIDDLLQLSQISRAEIIRQHVDLGERARRIAKNLSRREPQRRVEIRIADNLEVQGDPKLLQIVLETLMGNAWKFTSKNANAEIEIGKDGRHGRQCVFFIHDNGVGFDMAYANKLFGVFQRLHTADEFSGTGIGLAVVKRIIHRHGGRVWAEGEIEKGATFFFTL